MWAATSNRYLLLCPEPPGFSVAQEQESDSPTIQYLAELSATLVRNVVPVENNILNLATLYTQYGFVGSTYSSCSAAICLPIALGNLEQHL